MLVFGYIYLDPRSTDLRFCTYDFSKGWRFTWPVNQILQRWCGLKIGTACYETGEPSKIMTLRYSMMMVFKKNLTRKNPTFLQRGDFGVQEASQNDSSTDLAQEARFRLGWRRLWFRLSSSSHFRGHMYPALLALVRRVQRHMNRALQFPKSHLATVSAMMPSRRTTSSQFENLSDVALAVSGASFNAAKVIDHYHEEKIPQQKLVRVPKEVTESGFFGDYKKIVYVDEWRTLDPIVKKTPIFKENVITKPKLESIKNFLEAKTLGEVKRLYGSRDKTEDEWALHAHGAMFATSSGFRFVRERSHQHVWLFNSSIGHATTSTLLKKRIASKNQVIKDASFKPYFVPWASRQLTGTGRGMKTVLTGKKTTVASGMLRLADKEEGDSISGRDTFFAIGNNAHVGWKQQKKPISFFFYHQHGHFEKQNVYIH